MKWMSDDKVDKICRDLGEMEAAANTYRRKAVVRANLRLLGFWSLRFLIGVIWVTCVWGFISTYV